MRPSFRALFLISAASVILRVSLLNTLITLVGYIVFERLQQSSSRLVRFISRENRSTGWQPETDRTRLFIAWIRPPLLQLESI